MEIYKQVRPKDSKIGQLFKDKVGFEFTIPANKKVDRSSIRVHVDLDLMFLIRKTYQDSDGAIPPILTSRQANILTAYPEFINLASSPIDSFFNDCEVKINDTRVSFTDNYHMSSYIKNALAETEQKNIRNNCLNPVNQLAFGKEDNYIKSYNSLGVDKKPFPNTYVNVGVLNEDNYNNNIASTDISFSGQLNALICEDHLPGNIKVNIDFNVNSNYLQQLLFFAPGSNPVSETLLANGITYNLSKDIFIKYDDIALNEYRINSLIKDIYITYNEYPSMPTYKQYAIPFTEIYTTSVQIPTPVQNIPYTFNDRLEIPHDIGSFCVAFRSVAESFEQCSTNTNYNNFDLTNYQFKYGNTLYPTTDKKLNFKRVVANSRGIRQDNNNVFKEYINQIAGINDSNGSLLNSKQWSMNPIFYYIVRRPENDTRQSFDIKLVIESQTQDMELLLFGFYHNVCTLNYDSSHIVKEINIEEL